MPKRREKMSNQERECKEHESRLSVRHSHSVMNVAVPAMRAAFQVSGMCAVNFVGDKTCVLMILGEFPLWLPTGIVNWIGQVTWPAIPPRTSSRHPDERPSGARSRR